LPALFYKDIINLLSTSVGSNEIASNAIAILMYIFWIKLVNAIFHRLMDYCIVTFEMNIQEDLYNKLFEYLQKHSFQFFSDNFTGSLISKIRKCIGSFERFTDTLSRGVIPFILNIVLILIIVGTQYLRIAVGLFVVVIICAIAQYKLYKWAYPYQEKANTLDSELGGVLSDDITNNFNIKIFSSFSREAKAFEEVNHANTKAWKTYFYKMMWVWGISRGLTGLILEIGTMYAALHLRGQGIISIGVIVLLQTYVLTLIEQL
jgi:ATP-binding cassette subfamily B protein